MPTFDDDQFTYKRLAPIIGNITTGKMQYDIENPDTLPAIKAQHWANIRFLADYIAATHPSFVPPGRRGK